MNDNLMSRGEFVKLHGKKAYREIIEPLLSADNLEYGTDPALRLIARVNQIIEQTLVLLRLNYHDGIMKNRQATKRIKNNLRRIAKRQSKAK